MEKVMKSFLKRDAGPSTGAERAADRRWAKAVWADEFYASVTQDGRPLFVVSRQVRRAEERRVEELALRAGRKDRQTLVLKEARAGAKVSGLAARFGRHKRRSADALASGKTTRGRLTRNGLTGLEAVGGA